ncbi:MAG: PAS domain S-box protein [Candidatus Pseudobacter hemicellulosilyticus]|uniref:histidine kinase n=1 Tax=Candidatus Pseudobacter hemicellulosilyticus TaxID=3121375 RepID=A0AAJ6BHX8_9BACT|nr:MAG: PAS domain S-box protein [Pseudobacter sp.]
MPFTAIFHNDNGNTLYCWDVKTVSNKLGEIISIIFTGVNADPAIKSDSVVPDIADSLPISDKEQFEVDLLKNAYTLDSLFEGLALYDKNGHIVYANKASGSIVGLPKEQIRGKISPEAGWKFIHEDGSIFDLQADPAAVTLRTGIACKNVVMGIYNPDSVLTWISINSQPIFIDGADKPAYVISSFVDITEQKKSVQEIINAERLLSLVLSSSSSSFILLDLDHRVTRYNNLALEYYSAITGRRELKAVYYPEIALALSDLNIHQILKNAGSGAEEIHETQIPVLGRDKWFEVMFRPVWDENKNIIGVYNLIKDITRKRLNAEALRITQTRFKEIFNSAFQFMAILNPAGEIEEVNDSFLQFSGNSPDAVKGKKIWDTYWWDIPGSSRTKFKEAVKMASGGITMRQEAEIRSQTTSALVDFSIKPVYDQSGKCNFLIVEGRPIDEQRKAEKELIKQEMQFTSFMNNSPTSAWIADEFNVIRYVSKTAHESFGIPSDAVGRAIETIFPADLANEYININKIVFNSNKPFETRTTSVDANGIARIQHLFKFPLGRDSNGIRLVGGVGMDITPIINTKKELRALYERYEFARKATSDIIWDWDIEKNVIAQGESSSRDYEFAKRKFSLEIKEARIHPEDRERYLASIKKVLKGKKAYWQFEYRLKNNRNRYRIIYDKAYIIRDDKMKAVRMIGAMQDITDQRKLENKLADKEKNRKKEVVKAIIKAQENERKEISHELHDNVCQILATCKLYIDVCMRESTDNTLLNDCKNMLITGIDEIRNLSHSLTPAAFEEKGLFQATEELIAQLNGLGRLTITLLVPENHLEYTIVPEMKTAIYRIIQEQLNNILKHANATKVDVVFSENRSGLHLMVKDNGIGFDFGKIKRGLGLNNIISRVSLFDGEVSFNSSPGHGCKMQVYFPIKKGQANEW